MRERQKDKELNERERYSNSVSARSNERWLVVILRLHPKRRSLVNFCPADLKAFCIRAQQLAPSTASSNS